jgi:two-component system sensor histidine kinase RegB
MQPVEARGFVEDVAAAWREVRVDVPLESRTDGIDGLKLLADPALRQAVWNLLDNAGEASPGLIHLAARRATDMLVIAVRDHGRGFSEAMLAQFGRPYQSSKGAGHGVGLFLVTNVARRLGGRVEPANLPDGGAEVRLFVPLAHDPIAEAR